ncbi:helix-turn-helix domain-containing protein [Sulfitobacter geojensis]|uniref:helix-turn-helix domain-containing protein n=1 Tax=Sulfitobacter geojensis TaxID=1342299 RepID=UPI000469EB0C|nr:helix-turn-helix transcriptional regulator [Sulfitobacter geojensis]KHA51283.1 Transcriptional regulator, AraC family [Sulfitobacter geojensis]NYI26363.1 AraC-like DNA-binding protein [Sulfitobacter geojensis]
MIFENVDAVVNIVLTGICLFCAHLLMLRRRDPGVYLPLALLFLFQGVSTGFAVLAETYDPANAGLLSRINLVTGALEIATPFLFWVYVRALTTEGQAERIPKLRNHIVPIVLVTLCFWSLLFLPVDLQETELKDDDPRLFAVVLVILAVLVADVVFKLMIGIYVYLTVRRLVAYQSRLKDIFASTENRELTWVWVILASAGFYLCVNLAFTVLISFGVITEQRYEAEMSTLHSLAVLALFWVIGVWGLRQRPGLVRQTESDAPEPELPPAQKYEKSALDHDRAERIARKIEAAMAKDLLYRAPDLSLWDLAKHIGVTSHYVSQTLNTHLGKSFFELVNGWRIKDAVTQLTTTDATILVIAYDVGFNSRSAFYKAFRRETGKTPSDLRG